MNVEQVTELTREAVDAVVASHQVALSPGGARRGDPPRPAGERRQRRAPRERCPGTRAALLANSEAAVALAETLASTGLCRREPG